MNKQCTINTAFLACVLSGLAMSTFHADVKAGEFSFNGKVFSNVSYLEQKNDAQGTRVSNTDLDLKRLYLGMNYQVDEAWSVHGIADINRLRGSGDVDLWLRNLYVQRKLGSHAVLKLGVADLPMMAITSKWYGFRYLDGDAASSQKIESSADWGVHLSSRLTEGVNAEVSVVSGGGFKRPDTGRRADVEVVLSWQPSANTVLVLGGYDGQLAGENSPIRTLYHTARRVDFMAAYADATWRLGARYSRGDNWSTLYTARDDRVHSWSGWASRKIAPQWSIFTRYDYNKPSDLIDPTRTSRYVNAGLEWQPDKTLRLALVGKRTTLERQLVGRMRTGNELGIWADWSF